MSEYSKPFDNIKKTKLFKDNQAGARVGLAGGA
ncbi:hypothetical protein NIES298_04680 [Microcystis aeruginosa NIES-298]|jgi:hypothetical protein|nr:hypothetical protein NIES298_04680 [Microcystis aeruginosa NIES-298]